VRAKVFICCPRSITFLIMIRVSAYILRCWQGLGTERVSESLNGCASQDPNRAGIDLISVAF
jgi:hypothetical protein